MRGHGCGDMVVAGAGARYVDVNYADARLTRIRADLSPDDGLGVLTGEDVLALSRPFPAGA